MEVDIRKHEPVRHDVRTGLAALRVQGRQIWGNTQHTLPEIVLRLMVGVGDLARLARDRENMASEAKKEFGNILLSTVRWIDDLGLDPMECLDLAVEAQEKFAKSGRSR